MNIVDAYIKFNGELIILISGLSGSGKSRLANNIAKDFKITKLDIEMHCKKDFNKTVKLPNDVVVTDWDDAESYDWKTINKLVNENKNKGVVLCAPYFPTKLLEFNSSFHIHIKITKQHLIESRKKFVKENQERCEKLNDLEALIVNQITYPWYLKYLEESKIDKYINSKEMTLDQVYDECCTFLFFRIQQWLDEYNKKITNTNPNTYETGQISQYGKNENISTDMSTATSTTMSKYSDMEGNIKDDSSMTSTDSIKSDESVFLGTTLDRDLESQYY
jgi:hypothetical protein